MLDFIAQNWGTLFVGGVVLAALVLATVKIVKDKRSGKSSCGCSCSGCPMSESCHKEKKL